MKRVTLVVNRGLLEEAKCVLGMKTYSEAANMALREVLRIRKIQSLPQFFGRRLWQGDLAAMREDWRRVPPGRSARDSHA